MLGSFAKMTSLSNCTGVTAMQLHVAPISQICQRFQGGKGVDSAHSRCKSNFRIYFFFFCELGKTTVFLLALYINTKNSLSNSSKTELG